MVMKNFLLGLSKFVLGIILAMLIMSVAGLAMAKFFMSRIVELPERPVYDNDLPEDQRPRPTAAAPEDAPETEVVVGEVEDTEEPEDEDDDDALPEGEYRAVVNQPVGLILRDGPGTSYAQIGGLDYQQSMVVFDEDNGWLNVELSNGRTGWIKDGNVDKE